MGGLSFRQGVRARTQDPGYDLKGDRPRECHSYAWQPLTGDFRGSEFAGSTYSPDGRWLFFNIQSPGITFACTGPWRNGAL